MKFLFALLFAITTSSAFAQKHIVSIDAFDLSYTAGLSLSRNNANKGADQDNSNFRLNLNFAKNLEKYAGLMWKGELHWNRESTDQGSNDTLNRSFAASAGFLHNFDYDNYKNSILAGAQVGFEHMVIENNTEDSSGFNLYLKLEAGKRWDLGQYSAANISFAPTIDLILKRYGGSIRDDYFTSGRELRFNVLKFDILF
jgi:hypothetical protein